MTTKIDYLVAAMAGVATAGFLWITLQFLGALRALPFPSIALFLVVPVLWVLGVWLGGFLGARFMPFFNQFGKFAVVGFLSASIDFAVLNFMSYLTGITAGVTVGWINVPGFLIAVVNGYLWNKLWVFGAPPSLKSDFGTPKKSDFFPGGGLFHDFPKFFGVTSIGLLINSGIIVLLTTYVPIPPISTKLWLNAAKIIANGFAMIWNFLGYKFIAFR